MRFAVLLPLIFLAAPVMADDAGADYVLILKGDTFTPSTLTVPAHQQIKLTVSNETSANAEFESADFEREKVVTAGSKIVVSIGPLEPGSYKYYNDFHRETTGTIIAK